ncbi:beta-propeller fold lactonase family protein [Fuerstiella marisgermanici]|uniref:Cytochrome c551 peroxidase n=1 Tax=Fuerstiella marisgermanici TaxID=1891926 RepID=A0A1P8WDF3_9PLAN|nr:beta-propeller fold lactonase family protein [Fuerstiella marisgermanici]APZ92096.1 Cytochrome c551 peroxidase precursor [Fuerstiella marisgermanici]
MRNHVFPSTKNTDLRRPQLFRGSLLSSSLLLATVVVAVAFQAGSAVASERASSNSLLSINHDGSLIACSNRDSGTVTVLEADGLAKTFEVEVGLHPEGTVFIGQSGMVACCVYGSDEVVIVDSETGKVSRRVSVFDEPYGIVSSADGRYLYATLEYPGQVIRIDTSTWKVDAEWSVGKMLRGIALTPDQKSLFVTEYLTTRLLQISTDTGKVVDEFTGASTDNIARQVTLHPTRPKAFLPHARSKITAAHGNGSIFPYVGVATFGGDNAGRRVRIPMDTFRGTRVVANPWEVAVSPDGQFLFTVFGGTNDLYVAQIQDDDYQELTYVATVRLGNNPRAVRITPDGNSMLIYNAMDFELVAYSLPDLKVTERAKTTENPLSKELHLGKTLFYTALQPMSGRQWISCSSCHIDGDPDGRTWQQPEGLRQTQSLKGLAWTHPLHWSADRDEVQDFEHTIQGKLMQGKGFVKGGLPDALADRISGRSEMLDAIAVYANSHKFTLSPHSKSGLSDAAKRGQKIFQSSATKCAECHSGPYYCDSQPGDVASFKRHDVGTGNDDPSELMEPAYDTPTLLGIYRSAPYLHHGKAATLKDVLTTQNADDKHGVTSQLSENQIDDLVEFLKALPFEDPEPAAEAAGMVKVVK